VVGSFEHAVVWLERTITPKTHRAILTPQKSGLSMRRPLFALALGAVCLFALSPAASAKTQGRHRPHSAG